MIWQMAWPWYYVFPMFFGVSIALMGLIYGLCAAGVIED